MKRKPEISIRTLAITAIILLLVVVVLFVIVLNKVRKKKDLPIVNSVSTEDGTESGFRASGVDLIDYGDEDSGDKPVEYSDSEMAELAEQTSETEEKAPTVNSKGHKEGSIAWLLDEYPNDNVTLIEKLQVNPDFLEGLSQGSNVPAGSYTIVDRSTKKGTTTLTLSTEDTDAYIVVEIKGNKVKVKEEYNKLSRRYPIIVFSGRPSFDTKLYDWCADNKLKGVWYMAYNDLDNENYVYKFHLVPTHFDYSEDTDKAVYLYVSEDATFTKYKDAVPEEEDLPEDETQ